jgi:hypothetical protein
MQAEHYPGVRFPGTKYHPRVPGAFSLRAFLQANRKRFGDRTFICGPFKDGDDSWKAAYETVPYGLCAQLVRVKTRLDNKPKASDVRKNLDADKKSKKKAKSKRQAEAGVDLQQPSPSRWKEIPHWADHLNRSIEGMEEEGQER